MTFAPGISWRKIATLSFASPVIAHQELIDSMKSDAILQGATLDPHTAFMIQRGLKTYFLRYERQCSNAARVAEFLEKHPAVAQVRYPGLGSHPQHALAMRQMSDMGTIVTFELAPDLEPKAFANALKIFAIAASVGSTESLIQPGQLMTPRDLSPSERDWSAVSPATMRLSCGIEDETDLIEDLRQAFEIASNERKNE